jgi:hypothetical protein
LAFAEHVVTNAARLWIELGLEDRQRLQQALFPEGLSFDGEKFGTAVTCLAFKKLEKVGDHKQEWRPQRDSVPLAHANGVRRKQEERWWTNATERSEGVVRPQREQGIRTDQCFWKGRSRREVKRSTF